MSTEYFNSSNGIAPRRAILLYGPPGTGKSKLGELMANFMGSNFHYIQSTDIITPYYGESEQNLQKIFQCCAIDNSYNNDQINHTILFFDEIDSICRQRTSSEGSFFAICFFSEF